MTNPNGTTTPAPALVFASPEPLERKSWQVSTGPKYIGLFLWVVYFDQLARWTLPQGGLTASVFGALGASVLCVLLLYSPTAFWGFRTGRPLLTLAASTFGATGSAYLAGTLIGIAQVVWFAVATGYATDLTFLGLASCGLMRPAWLEPTHVGSLALPNAVFLITSLVWSFAAAPVGHYLVRVIGALMNVYPIFMAFLLGATVCLMLPNAPKFQAYWQAHAAAGAGPGMARAVIMMIELVFGFFATAGVLAADWGTVNRTARDVRLGGWVAVGFASWTIATLALLAVAGGEGGMPGSSTAGLHFGPGLVPLDWTFRGVVLRRIGGSLGAIILIIFGLGSMGPTCFAAYIYGHRFADAWPRVKRFRWTMLGAGAAWLLIATGAAARIATIFAVMGATFAPMAAAMAADELLQRGGWRGARRGVNPPGLIAWSLGLVVGLVPVVSEAVGWTPGTWFQPAALFGYLTAFAAYLALAVIGLEAPVVPAVPADTTADATAA